MPVLFCGLQVTSIRPIRFPLPKIPNNFLISLLFSILGCGNTGIKYQFTKRPGINPHSDDPKIRMRYKIQRFSKNGGNFQKSDW